VIYPARYPMTIEQRADFDRSFSLKDGTGAPINFTGYTVSAALWTERRTKLLDFTLTWINQALGQFKLTLTDTQTTGLSGAAIWDLLVIDPSGLKDYYIRGDVTIEPGFTV